jgi:hypothetical protein
MGKENGQKPPQTGLQCAQSKEKIKAKNEKAPITFATGAFALHLIYVLLKFAF